MTPQYQLSADLERDNQVDVFNPGNAYDHWNAVLGFALHRELLRELESTGPWFETRSPRRAASGAVPRGFWSRAGI